MRLHRFYIAEPIGEKTELTIRSAELSHQIRNVFRLKAGDSLVIFDGSGSDYECTIDSFNGKSIIDSDSEIRLHVATTRRSAFSPGREIVLCAAIVKKDTFEWIVEKATELGVTKIIPVMAERSEKKALNEMRLKKIAIEASEQSGRGDIPFMHPIISLKECLEWVSLHKIPAVVFHTEGDVFEKKDFQDDGLEVFIGPEGGWSPDEIAMFHEHKVPIRSLGKQVLRAETAVIAALSQLVFGN